MKLGSVPWNAQIKGTDVVFRFYELDKIHGPFKFYVGTAEAYIPIYIVESDAIYQRWTHNYVEVVFPLEEINNLRSFYFTAVTVKPDQEYLVARGRVIL